MCGWGMSDHNELFLFFLHAEVIIGFINAPYIANDIYELTEIFFSNLAFPFAPPERVTINPNRAKITILDDNSK